MCRLQKFTQKMKSITQRPNAEIINDIKCIVDILGKDGKSELMKTLMLFEPDREYYNIRDFYEGIIVYMNYKQNKKVQDYLSSLKI